MKKLWILLVILILANMMGYIYVLVSDVGMIITNPGLYNETVTKLGVDAGKLVLASQSTISVSIQKLKAEPDMSYIDRDFLHKHILGGVAFTLFLIFIVFGVLKFFIRKEQISWWIWFGLFMFSAMIVGFLQVFVAWTIYSEVIFPYSGMLDLLRNFGVFWESVWKVIPENILEYNITG